MDYACHTSNHLSRRTLLKAAGLSGLSWLTPLSTLLAREAEAKNQNGPAKSVILLWLDGGPSQLDTFDPHPGGKIGGETQAIDTALKGVQLSEGLEQLAERMQDISLIRSVTSKEGDHERAAYNMKTGYRPNPSVVHPSIGSVICHQLTDTSVEIPRHVSILANNRAGRGGTLGSRYDAFRIGDPANRIPDVTPRVDDARMQTRLEDLAVIDRQFARGRRPDLEQNLTLHKATMTQAMQMMHSDQLKAFDVNEIPASERKTYGDTAFGRGCLAAVRLIETGVRCVEVTLGGFDTHVNNHEFHMGKKAILDPAFAALIDALKARDLLKSTVVLCGGEFGRTPKINPADGRDHWPHGFSVAVAGGGFVGGQVIGATDPEGEKQEPKDAVKVQDIHATVLHALGIDPENEYTTGAGRPIMLSDGKLIKGLMPV
ncbi:MAG: hypothetical protein ACI9TH_003708 [Kiritimatiellia bacterium]|jgi:hypothetical protein